MTVSLGEVLLAGASGAEAGHSHPTWADFTPTIWIVLVLVSIATGWTIWKAVMYTVRPGEQETDHIKRLILSDALPAHEVRAAATVTEETHD